VTTIAESILREKSKEFAKQIIFLCRDIKANMKESVLTNQLLRSGTSIGANIEKFFMLTEKPALSSVNFIK
jgi:four helix bundle protein